MITAENTSVNTLDAIWLDQLAELANFGRPVGPRGLATLELSQSTLVVDMRFPVLTIPERKLNYRFMAAEARWILTGDDRVETISEYNKKIAQFSDDGQTFFGAYGPRWVEQRGFVISALKRDPATRQAGVTFWRPVPPRTKDVPCTVALFFQLRDGKLNCHGFMRSSDIWLGIPYDVFNFSMLSCEVLSLLQPEDCAAEPPLELGTLYLTLASSHLYEKNIPAAVRILDEALSITSRPRQRPIPPEIYASNAGLVSWWLTRIADGPDRGPARWWQEPQP